MRPLLIISLISFGLGCTPEESRKQVDVPTETTPITSSRHLFVWAGDADEKDSDFLAVLDVDPESPRYTEVVATVPVGLSGMAHHTEHSMADDGRLFANAFSAGATFVFELTDPLHPTLISSFTNIGDYTYPHSFERMPNGNVLATFQNKGEGNAETGGLVELTPDGELVRATDAADSAEPDLRPYSLGLVPKLDRVITTTDDMRAEFKNSSVQVWRLSDLTLLATLSLPPGPAGLEHFYPAEARVLSDGRRVLVTTFSCGFYLLDRLDTDTPRLRLVLSYPWEKWEHECSLPVQAGDFWVQTVAVSTIQALVSIDLSDPERPREVDRLVLGSQDLPHWISLEPEGDRIVLTGKGTLAGRVLLVRINRETGDLALDESFRKRGAEVVGVDFGREEWQHGVTGAAVPHGAVFSRH